MTRTSVCSALLSLCAALAIGGAAQAQGFSSEPPVPRLDEKPIAYGHVFNEGGLAYNGDTCHILRVEAGQVLGIAAVVLSHQPTLELVDGGRCIFARETDHLPRLTEKAKDKSSSVYRRVDRPGYYSVRVTAEGATRDTPATFTAAPLNK